MDEQEVNKKCSSKEHENIDAISFCQQCSIYLCNKCDNIHKNLCQYHNPYNINKNLNDIFTGYCMEKNHNNKIEYFCKIHNQLCCDSCIIKIKVKGKGQHKDCDLCVLEEIKELKKSKLKENINYLQELLFNIEEKINQLKITVEKINVEKEELKLKIQKIFTKIRNIINEREEKLLLEVDKQFDENYFNENIINEAEKLPNKIRLSLEKGKLIDKDWNNEDKLSSILNDCINIENNIKNAGNINNNLKKYNDSPNSKIFFYPNDENEINKILNPIFSFGKIYNNSLVLIESNIINKNEQYIKNIVNWIDCKNNIITELLYRKTSNGDSYDTFHQLCDNKGATLILIKGVEGFIIGGFTPLSWDSCSDWKKDKKSFLFSLTNNKIFNKNEKYMESIKCSKNCGPYFHCFGFASGKNMNKLHFARGCSNYNNLDEIFPKGGKQDNFDIEEVEIYKIIFVD